MKVKVLVIVCILFTIFALLPSPVSAASQSGTTALTGNPSSYVSISLNESAMPLTLTPGSTATNSTLGITVSANNAFSITVGDNTGRSSGDLGFMGNWTGSAYDPINTKLLNPLKVFGTSSSTTTANIDSGSPADITTTRTLYTGTAPVTNQLLAPNTFSQKVEDTDVVLPSPSVYKIDLIYTISAN